MKKDGKKTIQKKEKEEIKKKFKISKKIKIIFLVLVISIIIFIGIKLYLLVNFLLGNDIIIKLETRAQNIFLNHSQAKEVEFKTSILTNPFCNAECSYEFIDLGINNIIEKNKFVLKNLEPITKTYTLTAPSKGRGQKLYRFGIACKSIKTALCQTSGSISEQSYLITINYDLNEEEKRIKESVELQYTALADKNENRLLYLLELNASIQNITQLNKSDLNAQIDNFVKIKEELAKAKNNIIEEEYGPAILILEKISAGQNVKEADFLEFNNSFHGILIEYNNISNSIDLLLANISLIKQTNFSNSTIILAEEIIEETNIFLETLNSYFSFEDKNQELEVLMQKTRNIINLTINEKEQNITQEKTVTKIPANNTLEKIFLNISYLVPKEVIEEQEEICCFLNNCIKCCDESCSNNASLYPIIFIHGHDFSASVSPEYNLNAFEPMQKELEKYGYLNAGALTIITPENKINSILGKTNYPVSIRASYYFDYLNEPDKISILYTKQDSIDTYSIRLSEIIKDVKYRTGKEKVILITHSMGGLVLRRYMQIFGDESIYKAILIGGPNKGITESAYNSCKLFGENTECNDMYEKSLLINKLNTQKKPLNTKIYNIIGTGCETYGDDGDGVVTNTSAYLEFADNNYYINGNCSDGAFDYLHIKMINPKKHPETLKIINEILKK